ncbi:MAG: Rpn family recombination-promoting nuclease/putative transposase [Parabacteroides sp.]|nr:Rpn family recombination-promoting nuclease/putative transposase [Parabacteroides sp.]
MKYLDPKADLTFKRVFGEHPDLVMSFLNALLPLETGQEIDSIEYLPVELVPDNPLRKNSIVDVRCRDKQGRLFLVEMQMIWSPEFKQRVLFNASKAYVRQLNIGEQYELLQPVYSLNLVNDIFELDLPQEFYHYYRLVHVEHTEKVIEGLHLVFVELPKFTAHNYSEKKMQVLWLRYLTEINEQTREVPAEFLANPELKKAVNALEESAFTDAQLAGYEKFWDIISVEKTLYGSAERRGMAKGMQQGIEQGIRQGIEQGMKQGIKQGIQQGIQQGIEQGKVEGIREVAQNMKKAGIPNAIIMQSTGLSENEIELLKI